MISALISTDHCPDGKGLEFEGGVVLQVCIMLYLFIALAIICDTYFVASLERLSVYFNLPDDIAGATLMAAGGSAPELFVTLADNVFTRPGKSIGIGAVIGSAIFNILVIIAFSALLSKKTLTLHWEMVLRDAVWYCIAIFVLSMVIVDNKVNLFESMALLSGYVLYIAYIFYGPNLNLDLHQVYSKVLEWQGEEPTKDEQQDVENHDDDASQQPTDMMKTREAQDLENYTDDRAYFSILYDVPERVHEKCWFVLSWPIHAICKISIPDCRFPIFHHVFGLVASFVASICWIGVLSHYTTVIVTEIGCQAHIDFPIMGLTILAAGTSIPDALASISVARAGHGDMAVSNAFGSNIFDIFLGLGFPFVLSNWIYSEPVSVQSDDLHFSVSLLLGILICVVALLIFSRWELKSYVGGGLLVVYAIYLSLIYWHQSSTASDVI